MPLRRRSERGCVATSVIFPRPLPTALLRCRRHGRGRSFSFARGGRALVHRRAAWCGDITSPLRASEPGALLGGLRWCHASRRAFDWRISRHDAVAALPGLAPAMACSRSSSTGLHPFLAQQQDRSARRPPLRCRPEGCGSAVAALTDRRQGPRWSRVHIAVKEITMAQIGTFTRGEDGSYTGTIRTLSLNIKVRFVPAEPSQNEKAPDLRVLAGNNVEIGAAWKRLSKENTVYHSVKLDDPSFPAPIYANLVEVEGGHALVWSR